MKFTTKLFVVLTLAAVYLVSNVTWAACNQCGRNSGIACINSTAYNLCNNNQKPTGLIGVCPDGTYCSSTALKCVVGAENIDCPDSQAVAGCGCTANTGVIACTSRNTFVVCENGAATTQTGICPDGYVCNTDPKPKKICVTDTCNLPTCDSETPI